MLKKPDGKDNLLITRGKRTYVVMNRYPYTSGHIMVVPYSHVDTFEKMDKQTCAEVMLMIRQGIKAIGKVYKPDGYNIGANLGASAGAGITNHVHFHLVPRWNGDTNFMTAVSGTRVLPEDLYETYRRLKDAWPKD
ncbi:MAG: HIT domain-containing protein [Anaerolineaceae bacterium]|nr:HIT domain-containing protein [Anaerolineaceae bacterium]